MDGALRVDDHAATASGRADAVGRRGDVQRRKRIAARIAQIGRSSGWSGSERSSQTTGPLPDRTAWGHSTFPSGFLFVPSAEDR